MKKVYTIILFILICSFSYAQKDTSSTKLVRNLSVIPLPAIASNPTNGFMIGMAPGMSWYMGDPNTTSVSSALGTVIYTSKKQWIITLKSNTFLSEDGWNLMGDWRYLITSQPTYGLGTGPQSAKPISNGLIEYTDNPYESISTAQMMEFNYFRFHETALKRYQDTRFFGGIGYHLDIHSDIVDNLLNPDSNVATSHYTYNVIEGIDYTGYTTSGISLNALYDSRDNAVNPYSGRYAFANIRINPEFLGSDKSSSMLWLEYRDYIHFNKERPRHLLGFWTYGWFVTSGSVPYLDLPALGWDQFGRSGRGYTQGRFRGEDVMYLESEYRFPLQKKKERFGGVAFVNAVTAGNRNGDINLFEYIDPAYGLGLRIMINKKSRANLNLDYAWGKYGSQGFYFGLNEAF